MPIYEILRAGGIAPGGFNFDAKLRRQSIDRTDLFHAHIGGLDTLARALLIAADLIESGELAERKDDRYSGWDGELGTAILGGTPEPRGPRGARRRRLEPATSGVRQPGGPRERRQPGDLVGRPLTSMAFVIGLDISTTATKAVVIDEAGVVVAAGAAEYGYEIPQPRWSEQDPGLWWDGTVAAIRSALAEAAIDGGEVAAVGLTGQMHGAVLLDSAGAVLRPAILWNDQRTADACDEIRRAVGPERLIEITGNDALTGFTAPKLVWVRDQEPEVWARVRHVLLPKDYVRFRLTGEYAIDKADGSGTLLFDLAARDWSSEVLDGAADRSGVAAPDASRARRSRASSPRPRPRRPDCVPAHRSSPGAAIRRRTPSVSARSRRGSSRCRSGRRASCSRRPRRRCATRPARSTRSAMRCPAGGT